MAVKKKAPAVKEMDKVEKFRRRFARINDAETMRAIVQAGEARALKIVTEQEEKKAWRNFLLCKKLGIGATVFHIGESGLIAHNTRLTIVRVMPRKKVVIFTNPVVGGVKVPLKSMSRLDLDDKPKDKLRDAVAAVRAQQQPMKFIDGSVGFTAAGSL